MCLQKFAGGAIAFDIENSNIYIEGSEFKNNNAEVWMNEKIQKFFFDKSNWTRTEGVFIF